MTAERAPGSGLGWAGAVALLACGIALGYSGYFWTQSAGPSHGAEDPHGAPDDGHGEAASAALSIPAPVQAANGIVIQMAEKRVFQTPLTVTGTVAADQARIAHIRALSRGIVDQIFVQLGDQVSAGDPLVSYDNINLGILIGEYREAQADLQSLITTLEVDATILARSGEMLAIQAIARTDHDVIEAAHKDSAARVDAARARVLELEEQLHRFGLTDEDLGRLDDEGEDYHRTASRTVLRAPAPGAVVELDASPGETISIASELLTISDISTVWVLADVSERDLGAVRVGDEVSIRLAAYHGELFRGRITYDGEIVDTRTRTARVRCVVENGDLRIKPGMFASVDIPTDSTHEAVAVPVEALQEIGGRTVVFVRIAAAEFERRAVAAGSESGGWVEIRSGLRIAEEVIAAGSSVAKSLAFGTEVSELR